MATRKPPARPRPNLRKLPKPRQLKVAPEVLLPGRNVRAQSRAAFAAEIAQRRRDQNAAGNTLLNPDEVAGDYILSRGLMTTLGGQIRPITSDDLKQFQHNVYNLRQQAQKARMLGGITAKQVIDKSWEDDRKRAQTQIRLANPTHYKAVSEAGGQGTSLMVGFFTNAGPDSEFTHHNVNVQFLDFGAAVASPMKADKAAKMLAKGRLKIECNCPRFKYFFRYVCTQAEIVAGRPETGFPKIRNPGVTGIACKHILRVMQTVSSSPTFTTYAARTIQKFRDDISHTEGVSKIADQRQFEQDRQGESSRQRRIQSSEEKRAKRAAQPAQQRLRVQREKEFDRMAAERTRRKEQERMSKNRNAARASIERGARELLKQGMLTKQQFDQMMAAAKGE